MFSRKLQRLSSWSNSTRKLETFIGQGKFLGCWCYTMTLTVMFKNIFKEAGKMLMENSITFNVFLLKPSLRFESKNIDEKIKIV